MKSFVLLTVCVAASYAASIGTDKLFNLISTYVEKCAEKSGVSTSALLLQNYDDPNYNAYLSCFLEKYFSGNNVNPNQKVGFTLIQNFTVLVSYSNECAVQSKISLTALLRLVDENPPEDDPNYKAYILCYLLKLGLLTEDGEISDDTSQIEKWMPSRLAKTVLETVKTKCAGQKGKTLEDTAVLLYRCFSKRSV